MWDDRDCQLQGQTRLETTGQMVPLSPLPSPHLLRALNTGETRAQPQLCPDTPTAHSSHQTLKNKENEKNEKKNWKIIKEKKRRTESSQIRVNTIFKRDKKFKSYFNE